MAKFIFTELVGTDATTARLGAGSGSGNNVTDTEKGKLVKLAGDSRYNLCASGDQIEGRISSLEPGTADAFTIGGVETCGRFTVVFNGLQATEGTGALVVGDFVVSGTQDAKGTALSTVAPKVVKATTQTGMYFAWRVVSLGPVGTGAVGTVGLIERVS